MKVHRTLLVVTAVVAMVTAMPYVAMADVTKTSDGNRLTVYTVLSGTDSVGTWVRCGGRNQKPDGVAPSYLLVSYVCQWRDGAGSWHDFFDNPPASDCDNGCRDTGVSYTRRWYPCFDLPPGDWRIRAQADGFWRESNGQRHDFAGTVVTSGMTVTVHGGTSC